MSLRRNGPLVSIIVRVYNNVETIERAIESAIGQTFPKDDFEIIVVNDGSRDNSSQVLAKYNEIGNLLVFNQKNSGPVKSAARGFKLSRGKFLVLLDADDYFKSNLVAEMSKILIRKPSVDFVYSKYFEEFAGRKKLVVPKNISETVAVGTMYRKSSLAKADYYREDVMFAEYDLLLRTKNKWRGYYCRKPLFTYSRRLGSITARGSLIKGGFEQLRSLHPDKLALINKIRSYEFVGGAITIREATKSDSTFLRNLRNEPSVRKSAFNSQVIDSATHKRWFTEKLANLNSYLFVIEVRGKRIGQARIDVDGQKGEVDIAILPNFRAKGYGSMAISQATQRVFRVNREVKQIVAHIKRKNLASVKSFVRAGFKRKGLVNFKNQKSLEMVLLR